MVKTLGQPFHKPLGANGTNRFPDLVVRDVLVVKPNVFPQRAAEQKHILQHDANLPSQHIHGDIANVYAVDGDSALLEFVEARNEVDNGTFARTCGTDKGHALARLH